MATRTLTFLAAAGIAATGALAAEPASEPQKQREVCRAAQRQLGSRIRTPRRCRTEEQWKEEEEGRSGLPVGAQVTQGQNDGQVRPQPQ